MKKICFFVLGLALFLALTSCSNGLGMTSVRIPVDFSELVASRNGDEQSAEFFASVTLKASARESGSDYTETRCRHFSASSEENAKFEFDFGAVPSGFTVHAEVRVIENEGNGEFSCYYGTSNSILLSKGRNSLDVSVGRNEDYFVDRTDFSVSAGGKQLSAYFYKGYDGTYLITDSCSNVISFGITGLEYTVEEISRNYIKELLYASDYSVKTEASGGSCIQVKRYGSVMNPREFYETESEDGMPVLKFKSANGLTFNVPLSY